MAAPSGLFNSSLEGNTRRAIDFHEGDEIDEETLKVLIRAAVALNTSASAANRPVLSQTRPGRHKSALNDCLAACLLARGHRRLL
jgi:hypothetical protein